MRRPYAAKCAVARMMRGLGGWIRMAIELRAQGETLFVLRDCRQDKYPDKASAEKQADHGRDAGTSR